MDRTPGFKGEFLWEFEIAERQLLALANAVPEEKFTWRPCDGARSAGEVFVHIAVGNFLLLDIVGVPAPADLYSGIESDSKPRIYGIVQKNDDLEKRVVAKPDVVALLERSLTAAREAFARTRESELCKEGQFFGEQTSVRRVYMRMLAHMHEHMGQMIAYTRANHLPAPWPDWRRPSTTTPAKS